MIYNCMFFAQLYLAEPTFSRKSCLVKNFAVMFCLKSLVSSFIDIIGVCHEISTEIFEAVSNQRVLQSEFSVKIVCEFSERVTPTRTRELDILGQVKRINTLRRWPFICCPTTEALVSPGQTQNLETQSRREPGWPRRPLQIHTFFPTN